MFAGDVVNSENILVKQLQECASDPSVKFIKVLTGSSFGDFNKTCVANYTLLENYFKPITNGKISFLNFSLAESVSNTSNNIELTAS